VFSTIARYIWVQTLAAVGLPLDQRQHIQPDRRPSDFPDEDRGPARRTLGNRNTPAAPAEAIAGTCMCVPTVEFIVSATREPPPHPRPAPV
jgi:hypothetical protein